METLLVYVEISCIESWWLSILQSWDKFSLWFPPTPTPHSRLSVISSSDFSSLSVFVFFIHHLPIFYAFIDKMEKILPFWWWLNEEKRQRNGIVVRWLLRGYAKQRSLNYAINLMEFNEAILKEKNVSKIFKFYTLIRVLKLNSQRTLIKWNANFQSKSDGTT